MSAAPRGWLSRLAAPLREFGAFAGVVYLLDRALGALLPRSALRLYDFVVQPVPDRPLLSASMARGYEYFEVLAGDPECARMPIPAQVVAARYRQGARCLAARARGEFVGYMWFSFGDFDEDEVRSRYVLPADGAAAFDFDLYILPERRAGLAFAAMWHGANAFLRERGVRRSFSRVNRFNVATRRAHARLGARDIGSALYLQCGRLEVMAGTLAPYLRISLGAAGAPRLLLRDPRAPAAPAATPAP
jgi:hypothetical protein